MPTLRQFPCRGKQGAWPSCNQQPDDVFHETQESRSTEAATAKADLSVRSGYRINRDPTLPSQKRALRGPSFSEPLAGIFEEEAVPTLDGDPGIRAVGVLEEPMRRHPELDTGVRRTVEPRIRDWRTRHSPDQGVIFQQTTRPVVREALPHVGLYVSMLLRPPRSGVCV